MVGHVFYITKLVWRAGAARGRKGGAMPDSQDKNSRLTDEEGVDRMVNEGGRVPPRTQTAAPQPQSPAEPPQKDVPPDVAHR